MTPASDPDLVDLGALRTAVAPVVAWYERFLDGQPMPVADLDHALVDVRALPPIGGRLGKALGVVASGGRGASTEETVAALEVLRHSAGLRHVPRPGAGGGGAAATAPHSARPPVDPAAPAGHQRHVRTPHPSRMVPRPRRGLPPALPGRQGPLRGCAGAPLLAGPVALP